MKGLGVEDRVDVMVEITVKLKLRTKTVRGSRVKFELIVRFAIKVLLQLP